MNPQQIWQNTLSQLQNEMSKASFNTWVKNAELLDESNGTFRIGVKNAYARDYLQERLGAKVAGLLSGFAAEPTSVEFVVSHPDDPAEMSEESQQRMARVEPLAPVAEGAKLLNRYRFDSFVVGASNRMAHAASLAVAENPAKAYNPLFLYGGVGLGKTHLLHAIGHEAEAHGLKVLYASSEEFTNDLINSIRTHTMQTFRDRYRSIDVLLIDDIQFIAGKESTQEEFFHTFNTLHNQDKQIVISSDRPPKAMVTLDERMRSRFEWGLSVDIQPPDLETRIAILRSKADRAMREVSSDVLYNIAKNIQANIRELEGALTRVLAFADLSGKPLDNAMVDVALADMLPKRSAVDSGTIIETVAAAYGMTWEEMVGRGRTSKVAVPRQIAMYLMRELGNFSLPQIGDALGGRDHTTVMYACDKVKDLIERDDKIRRQVLSLREQLFSRPVSAF